MEVKAAQVAQNPVRVGRSATLRDGERESERNGCRPDVDEAEEQELASRLVYDVSSGVVGSEALVFESCSSS